MFLQVCKTKIYKNVMHNLRVSFILVTLIFDYYEEKLEDQRVKVHEVYQQAIAALSSHCILKLTLILKYSIEKVN